MKEKPIVIGICGKMGSGKNYISEKYLLPELKSNGYIPLEMSFADQIKINVMTKDKLSYEELYINKSDKTRSLLQNEGTEKGRQQFGNDIWIQYLNNWISIYSKRGITAFVIPDVRFKNEASWIKSQGGLLIKVVAPKRNEARLRRESDGNPIVYKRIKLHASETEIDEIDQTLFDLVIDNEIDDEIQILETQDQINQIKLDKNTCIVNLIKDKLNDKKNMLSKRSIVQKYGGTSIGTPEKMKQVVDIIKSYNNQTTNLYIVVSAISSNKKESGTTNQLLKCIYNTVNSNNLELIKTQLGEIEKCHQNFALYIDNKELSAWVKKECEQIYSLLHAASIIGEMTIKSRDLIISKGEGMSAKIMTEYLKWANLDAVTKVASDNYNDNLNDNDVIKVFSGYVETPGGIIETVGRGYSDYTAGLISKSINADELQIWKEVDGIYSADPNTVLHAKLLNTISKEEAAQLTYYGCQAINPVTIETVRCPIRIKNCNNPNGEGTLVITDTKTSILKPIAVTIKDNISVINITSNKKSVSVDFFANVFSILKNNGIIVDLVSTSQVDISIAIDSEQKFDNIKLMQELSVIGKTELKNDMCVLSLIGKGLKSSIGIAAKMFKVLSKNNINIEMISQGASEINISCVIKKEDSHAALCHVHYDLVI